MTFDEPAFPSSLMPSSGGAIEAHRPANPALPEDETTDHPDGPRPESDRQREDDEIDEASEESFPASDPPSFNPLHTGKGPAT